MSIEWRYESTLNDGIIELIYCSNIDMTIPIKYYWNVLLKNGEEYDLLEPILDFLITSSIDKSILKQAKLNYSYLIV
jgi:hypothetical protein